MRECAVCLRYVKWNSYHCWTCRRCVQDMDHHCKFLNNCIGSRNYFSFLRLLMMSTLYLVISIGIGIWILVAEYNDSRIWELSFTSAPIIINATQSILMLLVVQMLFWFHCYISCCRRMTTIQYLIRHTPSNASSITHSHQENNTSEIGVTNGQLANHPSL